MASESGLIRSLSRLDVLMLSFGAMIGLGWVALGGMWITNGGALGAILAFAISGVVMVLVAIVYAELSAAMPKADGERLFVERAFNKRWGFIVAWAMGFGYVAVVVIQPIYLATIIEYLVEGASTKQQLWTFIGSPVYLSGAMIGVVGAIIIGTINYLGIKPAAVFQVIATIALFVAALVLITGAAVQPAAIAENFKPLFGSTKGIIVVLLTTPLMFVGFNVIAYTAEETKIKPRTMVKLMIWSVVGTAIFYGLVIFGTAVGLPAAEVASSALPSADAARNLLHSKIGSTILIVGGLAGVLTTWNGFFVGGSRILYTMSKAGSISPWFGVLNKNGVPSNAIAFIAAISLLTPWMGRQALIWFVDAGSFNIVAAYFIVIIAFIALRRKDPEMVRPFRAGRSELIGWLALISTFGILVLYLPGTPSSLQWPIEWLIVGAWWIIGFGLALHGRKSSSVVVG